MLLRVDHEAIDLLHIKVVRLLVAILHAHSVLLFWIREVVVVLVALRYLDPVLSMLFHVQAVSDLIAVFDLLLAFRLLTDLSDLSVAASLAAFFHERECLLSLHFHPSRRVVIRLVVLVEAEGFDSLFL